jgi:hypothetical protein
MCGRVFLAFVITFAAVSLSAQVTLSVEPESPTSRDHVMLRLDEYTRAERYDPPRIERSGTGIIVRQRERINTIAVIEGYGPLHWTMRTIDLGRLAAGTYVIILEQVIDYYPTTTQIMEFLQFHVDDAERAPRRREGR